MTAKQCQKREYALENGMQLTDTEFEKISKYVHQICGIALDTHKKYLIEQRLESVAVAQNCRNFTEFAQVISCCADDALRDQIIAAITTNETSFFRDKHPFLMFRNHILPRLIATAESRASRVPMRRGAKASILSAGASTGQEPYSMAVLIHEALQFRGKGGIASDDFSILATDVSSRALAKAIAGEYNEMEIGRGLSDLQKALYFTQAGPVWSIRDEIRRMVEFRKINFMQPFSYLGAFDVIFCRNVLIYFDEESKKRILKQFHSMLPDEGVLVLGASENAYGYGAMFESHSADGSIYYLKKN